MRKGWWNEAGFCYTPPEYSDEFGFGFRQDGRKIFINRFGQDALYIDYNLNVGDTITPCSLISDPSSYGDSNFIVQSIDSVLFSSGYHRRFHFNNYGGFTDTIPYYLLEGVGVFSNTGASGLDHMLFIINEPFEWIGTINCYLQNDILEYGSGFCDLNEFNFSVGLQENELQPKTNVKIVDLLGRETEDKPNTLLIYIYSDGTSEKVFRIE